MCKREFSGKRFRVSNNKSNINSFYNLNKNLQSIVKLRYYFCVHCFFDLTDTPVGPFCGGGGLHAE